MSHLHIPDGIIAIWLWIVGYIAVGAYFFAVYLHLKKQAEYKKIAIVSVLAALMLLSMSVPIPFFLPYHLNLSALSGILVGPFYAGLAIFCVNLILALIGHGGITIVGLNTIVLITEAAIAFLVFRNLKKLIGKVFPAAFLATIVALIVSTFLTVGIVYTGTQDFDYMIHKHHHECDGCIHTEDFSSENETETFDIKRFIALILITGVFGWTLEAFISAFIINYINRVKPDLLEDKGT